MPSTPRFAYATMRGLGAGGSRSRLGRDPAAWEAARAFAAAPAEGMGDEHIRSRAPARGLWTLQRR